MSSVHPIKKIVWSVDAFAEEKKLQNQMIKTLQALTKGKSIEIEPVFVLVPPNPYLPRAGFISLLEDFEADARKSLEKWLKKVKIKGLKEPKILTQNVYSNRTAVKTLIEHAQTSGADLIALGTHARGGVARALLGSFAETLLLSPSDIPVLVVNPKSQVKPSVKEVLFASDFGPNTMGDFEKIVNFAKSFNAKVIVYHKIEILTEFAAPTFQATPAYEEYLKADRQRRLDIKGELERTGKSAGVKVEVVIDEGKGYVDDSIVKLAKKRKPFLIAVASHSGTLSTVLIGSIARYVLRKAPCPVWVIHPPKDGKNKDTGKSYSPHVAAVSTSN